MHLGKVGQLYVLALMVIIGCERDQDHSGDSGGAGRPTGEGAAGNWEALDTISATTLANMKNDNAVRADRLQMDVWESQANGHQYRMWLKADGTGRYQTGETRSALRWYSFGVAQAFVFCTVLSPDSEVVACGHARVDSTYLRTGPHAGSWYFTLSWQQGNNAVAPIQFISCCSIPRPLRQSSKR